MEKNIQESFVGKTSKKRPTEIVLRKLELDEQSFFSLLCDYTDSLGITNFNKGDIVDDKSESGRERPVIVQKEVKRHFNPESGAVGSFIVSLVVSPYSYFWGRATEIPVFDLKFKVLFYPNKNEVRIGIYVNDYKADCCRKNGVSYEVIPRHFFRKSDGRFLDKGHDFFHRPEKFFKLTKMGVDTDTLEICKNYIKLIADFKVEAEKGVGVLDLSNESLEDAVTKVQSVFGTELFHLEENVLESFTKKISSKKDSDLVPSIKHPNGVYILHETLGIKDVEEWNKKFNNGVIGILLVEDDHQIVVALEDSPENLIWSKEEKLVNRPIGNEKDAKSDFNGEMYCRNLNSPDFPVAYYCLNYKKGDRNWYLPSSGELWTIYRHLEEIQTALSIVGGQKFVTTWNEDTPWYWSSTEHNATLAWDLYLGDGHLSYGDHKGIFNNKVRPVSKFQPSELKESFVKKISSKKNTDLISDIKYPDGVYIVHESLGIKPSEDWKWNPELNEGVVGILVVQDGHQIVVATEDSPEPLRWSEGKKLMNPNNYEMYENEPRNDYNGEEYCKKLNSPEYPAAYYCLNYNKGGFKWYLPSAGELWLIYNNLFDIQKALQKSGSQAIRLSDGFRSSYSYWSSTEFSDEHAWGLNVGMGYLSYSKHKNEGIKVRPVTKLNLKMALKESFVKKTRKSNSKEIVQDADDKAFNPVMDAKEFVNRMEECILSYKQPYVYGKKNPYNLEKFSFEMITSWPNTFKFNRQNYHTNELLFDVSNSKKPSFRIKLIFFENLNKDDHSRNIICYLTVGPIKLNKGINDDRLFQYIYDSKKKRISFVENPEGVRFDDNMESIEPTLRNLNFILNDIRFLMDNWKILYKTYLKKDSFETWNEFYKMLPSQNNKGFDFDLKESFVHKVSKKTTDSLEGGEMFGEMESFGEFDMLFKRFLKKHEHQFSSCLTTDYPFKSMAGKIGYKVVLKKDCPFEDGSDDRTVLRFSLDVFQGDIMNFPEDQDLNTPHGILTVAFYTELGPSTPQQINLANLEFIGGNESPVDFRFVKFKERREWEKPNFSYQLLFGLERFLLALVETMNNMNEQTWSEIGRTSANFNPFKGEACCGADSKIILDILEKHGFYSELHKNFSKVNLTGINESFTKKVSSKKNSDLVPDVSYPNGVYIVHETLGIEPYLDWKWNPDVNKGVIGILVVENEHQIMVALEDAPEVFKWSEKHKLVNRPKNSNEAESDFDGEEYRKRLNSPDFPASYYCSSYNKGGRDWYLPSLGELRLIYRNLDDIQTALEIVDGQSIVDSWGEGNPVYGSSTEFNTKRVWTLGFEDGFLYNSNDKVNDSFKVRPVSKFKPSELRESFTKKIKNKSIKDLTDNQSFQLENGLYILHETLGVQDAETWNSKYNKGVVGVLLIHNEHKFVASVDVSPKLYWSEKTGNFTAEQYRKRAYALGDYDSEKNCSVLNSPEFPAAYYCLNYNKGGRKWRLGSLGEMSLLVTRYREDFNRILEKVGAVNLKGRGKTNSNWYWTSTEYSRGKAWTFYLDGGWSNAFGTIERYKTEDTFTVIPVSTFEYNNLEESFVGKVSRKRKSDLVPDLDYPDGVYILHETLGVKTTDGWNLKDNEGVIGILLVEDNHQIVVALEDSPENLNWSKERKLVNQSIKVVKDAESDFNGEEYCKSLNSPEFPAAYYCLNYKKGNRSWYLPSSGELLLIYRHLEEIQTALLIVGGKKFVTVWKDYNVPRYWSSSERNSIYAWYLHIDEGIFNYRSTKVSYRYGVRPISKFHSSELKESFTKKQRPKEETEKIL